MDSNQTRGGLIWDLPLRVFHWALLIAVVVSVVSAEVMDDMILHLQSGQVVLGLLVFRLIWGVIGPPSAQFHRFVRGPRAVLKYLRDRASRDRPGSGRRDIYHRTISRVSDCRASQLGNLDTSPESSCALRVDSAARGRHYFLLAQTATESGQADDYRIQRYSASDQTSSSTPRSTWSRSIDSNKALKLPSPKP